MRDNGLLLRPPSSHQWGCILSRGQLGARGSSGYVSRPPSSFSLPTFIPTFFQQTTCRFVFLKQHSSVYNEFLCSTCISTVFLQHHRQPSFTLPVQWASQPPSSWHYKLTFATTKQQERTPSRPTCTQTHTPTKGTRTHYYECSGDASRSTKEATLVH